MVSKWDKDREDRQYAERTGDWGIGYILTRVLIMAAVIGVVVLCVWGFRVLFAPAQGAGEAYRSQQAAPNRIEAQEQFEHRYQEILAADRNIGTARTALSVEPGNPNRQTEYIGLVQYCNRIVGEYNADARSFTKEQFRAADLPDQIDPKDPKTDCKE
jgi:hypothetical protein